MGEELNDRPEVGALPVEQVFFFEGEPVHQMEGKLPAITLEMPEGYARGTHLKMEVEVRVRNVRYEEIARGPEKGDLVRQHVFALEEIKLLRAFGADEADPGVGGSASVSEKVEHVYSLDPAGAQACYFDNAALEVVHRGLCEICADTVSTSVQNESESVEMSVGF